MDAGEAWTVPRREPRRHPHIRAHQNRTVIVGLPFGELFARTASLEECFEGAGAKIKGHLAVLYVKIAGERRQADLVCR
jgi:hypothetical protein